MAEKGNESLQFQIWKQTANTKVKNACSKKSKANSRKEKGDLCLQALSTRAERGNERNVRESRLLLGFYL
jgi:hypothetical protein